MFLVPGVVLLTPRTGAPVPVAVRPGAPLPALAVVPLDAAVAGRAIPLPTPPGPVAAAAGRAPVTVELVDVWRALSGADDVLVLLVPVPGFGRAAPGRARVVGARDCLVPVPAPAAFVDGG